MDYDYLNDPYAALRFASDIEPEQQSWLWPGRIPLGTLTLLIGDPGAGKSLLAADLAARVSAGRTLPEAGGGESAHAADQTREAERYVTERLAPRGVVLVCPEDGAADTLRPRLAAAGANLTRVSILEGVSDAYRPPVPPEPGSNLDEIPVQPFMLPKHAGPLGQAIRAHDHPRLVVLDPLHAVVSSDGSAGLGAVVARLAEIARRYGVAILAVGHLVKMRSLRMLYRVRGSLVLTAAARAVHLLHADPDDPDRRILCPLKTVYGPPPPALAFRIGPGPRLEWDPQARTGVAPGWESAVDLLDLSAEAQSALSEACDWLLNCVAGGARPAREVLDAAREGGLSIRTLRRAKRLCRVRSVKAEGVPGWLWSLGEDGRCGARTLH